MRVHMCAGMYTEIRRGIRSLLSLSNYSFEARSLPNPGTQFFLARSEASQTDPVILLSLSLRAGTAAHGCLACYVSTGI